MTARTSVVTQRQSWFDRATRPKTIARVSARVRGNTIILGEMTDKKKFGQKKGCGTWKIISTN